VQPFYIEPAKVRRLTAYNMALSDRMKPPVIHQIQLLLLRTDGRILVRVLPDDRVMVTKVEVMVLDPERAGGIAEGGRSDQGGRRLVGVPPRPGGAGPSPPSPPPPGTWQGM